MSIKVRIIKIGAAKSFEIIVVLAVRLASVPLFLYAWSAELYGEWLILYSFIVYFSLGGLGYGQAAANEMTIEKAREEHEEARITYQSTIAIVLLLSALLITSVSLLAFMLPLNIWLKIQIISVEDLRSILILFAFYAVIGQNVAPARGALRSVGKMHRAFVWNSIGLLLEFLALIFVLLQGGGPLPAAISMLIVRMFLLLLIYIDQYKYVPWARIGLAKANIRKIRRMLSPSVAFAGIPLGNAIINQGIILIIGNVFGPIEVVVFSTIRTITNLSTRIFELINQAFSPEVSMAWGANKKELLRKLHNVSCQMSLWLGLIITIGLYILGPWFYLTWTCGKVEMNLQLFWGFLCLIVFRGLWYTSFILPQSINRHQRPTIVYILSSIVGLGLSSLLIHMGLPWIFWGFIFVELVMIGVVLPQSLRLTSDGLGPFFSRVLVPPNPITIIKVIFTDK